MGIIPTEYTGISITRNEYGAQIHKIGAKNYLKPVRKNDNLVSYFSAPETNKLEKIYCTRNRGGNIVYVGKTRQSLSIRLRSGLNPIKGTGYYGYQWQDKEQVTLIVFNVYGIDDKILTGIEAELVFLIRLRTKRWPKYQTEIHFHNCLKCKHLARLLYSNL